MYEKHEERTFISFSIETTDCPSGILVQCTKNPNQAKQKSAQELRSAVRELCLFLGAYPPFFPNVFTILCSPRPLPCVWWVSAAAYPYPALGTSPCSWAVHECAFVHNGLLMPGVPCQQNKGNLKGWQDNVLLFLFGQMASVVENEWWCQPCLAWMFVLLVNPYL